MRNLHQTKLSLKKRDQQKTKKLLIESLRKILSQHGYTHFNLTEISSTAGLDKKMIKYHFGSLNNLLKTYIHEQDFWMPQTLPFHAGDDLKTRMITLLKDQSDRLRNCPEMQALILWQISTYHPVISQVVKLRDMEARKALVIDQQPLLPSGIRMDALLAILSSAMYALVLQCKAGNGPVWGLDISKESDYQTLSDTISGILDIVLNPN